MNIIRSNKHKIWLRLIIFLVIASFLCENVAWAGGNYQSHDTLAKESFFKNFHKYYEKYQNKFGYSIEDSSVVYKGLENIGDYLFKQKKGITKQNILRVAKERNNEFDQYIKFTGNFISETIDGNKFYYIDVNLIGKKKDKCPRRIIFYDKTNPPINHLKTLEDKWTSEDEQYARERGFWISDAPDSNNVSLPIPLIHKGTQEDPLKVVLIMPRSKFQKTKPSRLPIGLMSLASCLRDEAFLYKLNQKLNTGYENIADIPIIQVQIIDLQAEPDDFNLAEKLAEINPDIIGVTAVTPLFNGALKIAEIARTAVPDAIRIIGGVHISALAKKSEEVSRALIDSSYQLGVIREGEETLCEIILSLFKRGGLEKIKGVTWKENVNGKTAIHGVENRLGRRRALPLKDYPIPALSLDLLNLNGYQRLINVKGEDRGVAAVLFTSRGCPYNCIYCASKAVFPRKVDLLDAERVFEELKYYYNNGFRAFYIADDNFCYNKNRIIELARLIKKSGIKIEYAAMMRADSITPEVANALKESKCILACLGVETGDEKLLKKIKKRTNLEKIKIAREILGKTGIYVKYYLMVGLPGQDWDSIKETAEFILETKPDIVAVLPAIPYPGSPLSESGEIAVDDINYDVFMHEIESQDKDKETPHVFTSTDVMSKEEIELAYHLLKSLHKNINDDEKIRAIMEKIESLRQAKSERRSTEGRKKENPDASGERNGSISTDRGQSQTVLFTMLNGVLRDFMPMVNASLVAVVLKAYPNKDASFIEKLYDVIQRFSGLSTIKKLQKFNKRYPEDSLENIPILAAEANDLKKVLSEQIDISSFGKQLLELFKLDLAYTISVDNTTDINDVMKSNPSLSEARSLLVDTLGRTGEADYDKFSHVEKVLKAYPNVKNIFLVFDAKREIKQAREIADRLKGQGKRVHVIGIVYPMSSASAKEALKFTLKQIGYSGSTNPDTLNFADQSFESLSESLKNAGADMVLSGLSSDLSQIMKLHNLNNVHLVGGLSVGLVLEPDLYEMMEEQGIGVPEHRFVSSEADINEEVIKQLIGKPDIQHLYMKVVSKSQKAMHKKDVGGVAKIDVLRTVDGNVDIEKTIENLKIEYRAMIERVVQNAGIDTNEITGVLISEEIVHNPDDEYFIGYIYDHAFGPFIAIGKGGSEIEKQDKGNIVYIPIGVLNGNELLQHLDAWLMSADIPKELWQHYNQLIPKVIALVNKFNETYPDNIVQEFELNPVVVTGDSFTALDARMIIGKRPEKKEFERGLEYLFDTQKLNVAVIGATENWGIGAGITYNMVKDSRLGDVFLINPRSAEQGEKIFGRTAYKDITEIKEKVDIVFVSVSANKLKGAMIEIVQKARAQKKQQELTDAEVTPITVVLISGGMAEAGETGAELQDELLNMVREAQNDGIKINVVGPNCLGIYMSGCNGFFSTQEHVELPDFGKDNNTIAIIARSGGRIALFSEMLKEYLKQHKKGIGAAFSVGNCMDLCEADYLNAILDGNPAIDIIALYLEGFSEDKGLELCRAIERAKRAGKEVIIYLAGRNEKGSTAIRSHTASLASPYNRAVMALKAAGAELVNLPIEFEERIGQIAFNNKEFRIPIDTTKKIPVRGKGNIAAICYSGQSAVQLSDTDLSSGIHWAEFSNTLSGELKALLPDIVGKAQGDRIPNPFDTTPAINDKEFMECVEKMLESDDIDAVIVSMFPQMDIPKSKDWGSKEYTDGRSTINILKKIIELKGKYQNKPILVCLAGPKKGRFKEYFDMLEKEGISTFSYDYQAAQSLEYVADSESPNMGEEGGEGENKVRWVPYEELKARFKRPDEERGHLIAIERKDDGDLYPVFGDRNIKSIWGGIQIQEREEDMVHEQEISEIPLKIENFDITKKELSGEWQYLPEDLKQMFNGNSLLVTAKDGEQKSDYSLLIVAERHEHDVLGRTGILLKEGLPVVLEINGQEFFVELKGVGSPIGGFPTPHFRNAHTWFKEITGGCTIAESDREFNNLEMRRNSSKFQEGDTIRNLGDIHFENNDTLQGYIMRLIPSSIRAAFSGNIKFKNPKDPENAKKYAYYFGQELAELLILNPALLHRAAHLENLVLFEDGKKHALTDFSDTKPLHKVSNPKFWLVRSIDAILYEAKDNLGQVNIKSFLEGLAEKLYKSEKITKVQKDELLQKEDAEAIADFLMRAFIAKDVLTTRKGLGYIPYDTLETIKGFRDNICEFEDEFYMDKIKMLLNHLLWERENQKEFLKEALEPDQREIQEQIYKSREEIIEILNQINDNPKNINWESIPHALKYAIWGDIYLAVQEVYEYLKGELELIMILKEEISSIPIKDIISTLSTAITKLEKIDYFELLKIMRGNPLYLEGLVVLPYYGIFINDITYTASRKDNQNIIRDLLRDSSSGNDFDLISNAYLIEGLINIKKGKNLRALDTFSKYLSAWNLDYIDIDDKGEMFIKDMSVNKEKIDNPFREGLPTTFSGLLLDLAAVVAMLNSVQNFGKTYGLSFEELFVKYQNIIEEKIDYFNRHKDKLHQAGIFTLEFIQETYGRLKGVYFRNNPALSSPAVSPMRKIKDLFDSFKSSIIALKIKVKGEYEARKGELEKQLADYKQEGQTLILYADSFLKNGLALDLEDTLRLEKLVENNILGRIIVYAEDEKNGVVLEKLLRDIDSEIKIITLTKKELFSRYARRVNETGEIEALVDYAGSKGIRKEDILGVIKGYADERVGLDMLLEVLQIPVVTLEQKEGNAIYSFAQALKLMIVAKENKRGWFIVLPPIKTITEELQEEFEHYKKSLESLISA